jgi:hypothetical protein
MKNYENILSGKIGLLPVAKKTLSKINLCQRQKRTLSKIGLLPVDKIGHDNKSTRQNSYLPNVVSSQ